MLYTHTHHNIHILLYKNTFGTNIKVGQQKRGYRNTLDISQIRRAISCKAPRKVLHIHS